MADYGIECWSSKHWELIYLGTVPLLLLFGNLQYLYELNVLGIALPISMGILLWKHRFQLQSEDLILKYGFIYSGYKP